MNIIRDIKLLTAMCDAGFVKFVTKRVLKLLDYMIINHLLVVI